MKTHRMLSLFTLLLVGSLFAACTAPVACGLRRKRRLPPKPPRPAEAAPADDVVEIEYWQYNFEARIEAMNQLIAQFEAENPGIKVIHNSDIPYDQFRDKIAASVPAGVGPDVVSLFYGWQPAWVDAGYIVPLPADVFPPERSQRSSAPWCRRVSRTASSTRCPPQFAPWPCSTTRT